MADIASIKLKQPPGTALINLAFTALIVTALYFAREVLVPVALAVLFSFVLAPFVIRLQSWRFPRTLSVLVAVFVGFSIIFSLGGLMVSQANKLAEELPGYQQTLREKIQGLRGVAAGGSGTLERASKVLRELDTELQNPARGQAIEGLRSQPLDKPIPVEIRQPDPGTLTTLVAIIQPLIQPLTTTGIVVIFVIFILLQRQDLRNRFIRLVGSQDMQRTTAALDDAGQRLSRLFLNQIIVNASFGLIIGIGLNLIGVPSAPLWGLIAMILRFVPYVGSPISAIFPPYPCRRGRFGMGHALDDRRAVRQPSTHCRSGGRAAGVWTQFRPLPGRDCHFGFVLDLALGSDRTGSRNSPHGMSGRGRPPCRSPAVSRCTARQRAGTHSTATDLPADAGRRSDRSLATGADPSRDASLEDYYDTILLNGLRLAEADARLGRLDRERIERILATVNEVVDDLEVHEDAPPSEAVVADLRSNLARLEPVADAGLTTALLERWERPGAVLCIPGSGKLDEAAAVVLVQMLKRRGIGGAAETADAPRCRDFFRWTCRKRRPSASATSANRRTR